MNNQSEEERIKRLAHEITSLRIENFKLKQDNLVLKEEKIRYWAQQCRERMKKHSIASEEETNFVLAPISAPIVFPRQGFRSCIFN
jgi:hypothetical protein